MSAHPGINPSPPRARDPLDEPAEQVPVDVDGGRLVARIGPPPARSPIPVVGAPIAAILGARVIWQSPKGWHTDLRALTGPYPGPGGRLRIAIAAEGDWYRWRDEGVTPTPVEVYAAQVFLERPPA